MDERQGSRAAGIALGVLALAASVLWLLFWGVLGLVYLPYDAELGLWVFVGAMVALGILVLLVGVLLVRGRFPGRRGWLVVGATALTPLVFAVPLGLKEQEHKSDVTAAVERAFAERSGVENATVECSWEGEDEGSETWSCDLAGDRCVVDTSEAGGRTVARVVSCERDGGLVGRLVARGYARRTGLEDLEAECSRNIYADDSEPWDCVVTAPGRVDTCFAFTRAWREGRVSVAISYCERDIQQVVESTYTRRTGRAGGHASCLEDRYEDGQWTCDLGLASARDRCVILVPGAERGAPTVRISYCQRELAGAVNDVVARVYAKRYGIGSVKATCTLDEPDDWTCLMTTPAGQDRCGVNIERREAGPRVVLWASPCF
jgi:hypothetical protein